MGRDPAHEPWRQGPQRLLLGCVAAGGGRALATARHAAAGPAPHQRIRRQVSRDPRAWSEAAACRHQAAAGLSHSAVACQV